jgi:hypothetical protein
MADNWEQLKESELVDNDTIKAFVENRIPDEYSVEHRHRIKDSMIYIGNITKCVHNYLLVRKDYTYLVDVLNLVFTRARDLMNKYTF